MARPRGSRKHREQHLRLVTGGGRMIGYIRVSTAEQGTNGYSLDGQEERLQAAARREGVELVEVVCDVKSGAKQRDGLDEAWARVVAGEAEGILFPKLDRLGRSQLHLASLVEQARDQGLSLLSSDEGWQVYRGELRNEALPFLIALAQVERERISRRTREGLAVVKSQWQAPGAAGGEPDRGGGAGGRAAPPGAHHPAGDRRPQRRGPPDRQRWGVCAQHRLRDHPPPRPRRPPRGRTPEEKHPPREEGHSEAPRIARRQPRGSLTARRQRPGNDQQNPALQAENSHSKWHQDGGKGSCSPATGGRRSPIEVADGSCVGLRQPCWMAWITPRGALEAPGNGPRSFFLDRPGRNQRLPGLTQRRAAQSEDHTRQAAHEKPRRRETKMKRTVLMIVAGAAVGISLGAVAPASADLFDGMPSMGTMDTYNQYMGQFNGGMGQFPSAGPWSGGLMMGMPTTTIMQDYYTLLPQLQALQAWGHANGMPYALPGTLGGYGDTGGSASTYWGDKWAHELIRGDIPVYENNGAQITIYPDDLGGW